MTSGGIVLRGSGGMRRYLAPIAALLLQLAVSRQREYLADATGAQLLGHSTPLADALEPLEHAARAVPTVGPTVVFARAA